MIESPEVRSRLFPCFSAPILNQVLFDILELIKITLSSIKKESCSLCRYMDSDRRFQHVLEACGVNKSLLKLGVKEGDTVVVGDVCLCYIASLFLAHLSL